MKKFLCSSIFLAATGSFAAAITSVDTGVGADGNYAVVFKGAGVNPQVATTSNAIVLDFPGTTTKLAKSQRDKAVNENGIYSVNVNPSKGRVRAVVNLAAPSQYNVQVVGNDVVLVLPKKANVARAAVPGTARPITLKGQTDIVMAKAQQKEAEISASGMGIHDLAPQFHKNGKGGGVLTLALPSTNTEVNVTTEGASVVAVIKGYKVPKRGQKRLDVADYGSSVRYVDIIPKGNDTRVVVNMGRNAYEYVTYQNGRNYNIEVKRPSVSSEQQRIRELAGFGSNKRYTGAPLSLNFQDIEVRAVIQIIAEFTNSNIVVSDSVTGNVTLRLDNVPWDQALDIIMKTKGLAKREVNKVIYIAPENELNNLEIAALRAYNDKQNLQPLVSELIQVKYAKASELATIIRQTRQTATGTTTRDDSMLSARGSVTVDTRTNTVLVNDIPQKIQRIRELIESLDTPVRQVLLDARVVITADNFEKAFGGSFGLAFFGNKAGKNWAGTGSMSGSRAMTNVGYNNDAARNNAINTARRNGDSYAEWDANSTLADRVNVTNYSPNAAVGSGFGRYGITILGKEVAVDLELQAAQAEGRSETVSSPRVVTQDGYKALISKGREIPYSTTSENGTNTSFKDAKLKLEVTPHIAPNDRITMDISVTKDDVDASLNVSGEPAISTNEINTKVEVESGETLVMGGIYEQEQGTSVSKVPVLGDIPVVGGLFKNTNKTFSKNELLFFITPRIVDKGLTDYDKFSPLKDKQ